MSKILLDSLYNRSNNTRASGGIPFEGRVRGLVVSVKGYK